MGKKKITRWLPVVAMILIGLMMCPMWADTVVLTNGTEISGTVTRIVVGETIELLRVNYDTGEARLDTYRLAAVAKVEVKDVARIPFTLILKAGDYVSGTLLNSPLEEMIEFRTVDGAVLSFDADAISEVRLGIRRPGVMELIPAFGYGLSFSTGSASITRDAIAWFSEDWMLVASLGLKGWWGANQLSMGITNGLTHLRRIGRIYLGIGTSAAFNMTTLAWQASLNVRVVIPIQAFGEQSFISVGFGILQQ